MSICYQLNANHLNNRETNKYMELLELLKDENDLREVTFTADRNYGKFLRAALLNSDICFDKLLCVKFLNLEVEIKHVYPLKFCKSLKYVRIHRIIYQNDSTFIAIYLFMRSKTAEKVNLMFTDIYNSALVNLNKINRSDKAIYLLCLTARYVWNTFYTYVCQRTKHRFVHQFFTTTEIMNRTSKEPRGFFLGGIGTNEPYGKIESYRKVYPLLAKLPRHPVTTEDVYFNVPFRL